MSRKSFAQEYAEALIGKAVIWGPPIVGGLALGPVGVVVGVVATVAGIVGSGSSDGDSTRNASQSKESGSST